MMSFLFIAQSGGEMENKHDDNHQKFSKHKVFTSFGCLFFQDYIGKWKLLMYVIKGSFMLKLLISQQR